MAKVFLYFFILAGIIEGVLGGYALFRQEPPFIFSKKEATNSPQESAKIPQRIIIPKLKIETEVISTGLGPDGEMEMPENFEAVAWYKMGSPFGQKGSAVIAGHLDSKTGPAVFWRLSALTVGDEILVFDQDGREFRFEVTQTETYPEDQFPLEAVFSQDDKVRLNLITCKGYFNRTTKRYNKRIVVYSELKERETSPAPAEMIP